MLVEALDRHPIALPSRQGAKLERRPLIGEALIGLVQFRRRDSPAQVVPDRAGTACHVRIASRSSRSRRAANPAGVAGGAPEPLPKMRMSLMARWPHQREGDRIARIARAPALAAPRTRSGDPDAKPTDRRPRARTCRRRDVCRRKLRNDRRIRAEQSRLVVGIIHLDRFHVEHPAQIDREPFPSAGSARDTQKVRGFSSVSWSAGKPSRADEAVTGLR